MRPFADGVQGFPRMVRDMARKLGKQVRARRRRRDDRRRSRHPREARGAAHAPAAQRRRSRLESPDERRRRRQARERHASASRRATGPACSPITVADDGRGIDLEKRPRRDRRARARRRRDGARLTDAELLEFLFLPGFSTADEVTEISGRGVGLDVVRSMVAGGRRLGAHHVASSARARRSTCSCRSRCR